MWNNGYTVRHGAARGKKMPRDTFDTTTLNVTVPKNEISGPSAVTVVGSLTWYSRDQFQRPQHAKRAQHAQIDVDVCLRKNRHRTVLAETTQVEKPPVNINVYIMYPCVFTSYTTRGMFCN